jgi:tetraacyldisaccharide 4'-kinase
MNFNAPLFKPLRVLLFPFSLIYGLIVWVRNRLYDNKIFRSVTFNKPVICVGNLSAGGTGKSPMVEYLLRLLTPQTEAAVVSRGYKRRTKGYALAGVGSTALEIGDEPMQFHLKFPDVAVAVGEERVVAIPQLLHDRPGTGVIILDDAFQHRQVSAGLNILLTDFSHLYTRDWFLPKGNLRDERQSARRAHCIIVTKCRPDLSNKEKEQVIAELAIRNNQPVFFTTIRYGTPYHILSGERLEITKLHQVLLVSGIANPSALKKHLADTAGTYFELLFSDHHIFNTDDWRQINARYLAIDASQKMILTTEKDAVRLLKYKEHLAGLPFYVIPIHTDFLFEEGGQFNNIIATFIERYSTKNNTINEQKTVK